RISSAHWGYRWRYSAMAGRSPRRWRARNSSASRSTGLWSEVASRVAMRHPRVGRPAGTGSGVEEARQAGQDLLQPLQGADVAVAGRRRLQAQDLGHLDVAQLLEV